MNVDIAALALNVGSIVFGGLGVHFLVKRDRRVSRMENERRAELNGIRARLINLEQFKRDTSRYLESVGTKRGFPPWKERD